MRMVSQAKLKYRRWSLCTIEAYHILGGMPVSHWCDLRSLFEVRTCAITSIRDIPTTKCLVSNERCKAKPDNKRMGRIPPLCLCKKHVCAHRPQTLRDAVEMGKAKTSAKI